MTESFKVRPFDRVELDMHWSGRIVDSAYVWRVDDREYRLRTIGVGSDEQGEFAVLEPYEEPLEPGLWLRVEPQPDQMFDIVRTYCRLSVVRLNSMYIDPSLAVRQAGIDPASVNILISPPPLETELSMVFYESGAPAGEWIRTVRAAGGDVPPVTN
jgi:hypothetical protein